MERSDPTESLPDNQQEIVEKNAQNLPQKKEDEISESKTENSSKEILNQHEIQRNNMREYLIHGLGIPQNQVPIIQNFSQILKNQSDNIQLSLQNPSPKVCLILLNIWKQMCSQFINQKKKAVFNIFNIKQENREKYIHIFEPIGSIQLIIEGQKIINSSIHRVEDGVVYEGNTKFMSIQNRNVFQNYQGQVYSLQDPKPHGKGIFSVRTGKAFTKYQGSFNKGVKQGFGIQIHSNQSSYEGQWSQDLKNGFGRETIFDKKKKKKKNKGLMNQSISSSSKIQEQAKISKYEQIDQNNNEEKMLEADKDSQLKSNEQINGCSLKFQSIREGIKQIYQGNFVQGKRQGQGTQVTKYGIYKGQWKNGQKNGKGTIQYKNGAKYQGDWVDNCISGEGKYTEENGNVYQGQFENGVKQGMGTMTYHNGDVYEGSWEFNRKHGQGTYTYNGQQGDYYDGEWVRDVAEGEGTTMIDGIFFTGAFHKGMRHGMGEETDLDGNTIKGIWKNNELADKLAENGQLIQ